ncbi:MAG: hypothetical protein GY845_06070 [Planctomycetes bacterium]|nr:hypothetical protein [Planctomycetota bacterium]
MITSVRTAYHEKSTTASILCLVLVVLLIVWAGLVGSCNSGNSEDHSDEVVDEIYTPVGIVFDIVMPVTLRLGADWNGTHDEEYVSLMSITYEDSDLENPGLGGVRIFSYLALKAGVTRIDYVLSNGDQIIREHEVIVNIK